MKDVTHKKVTGSEQLQEVFRAAQTANTPVSLYRSPQPGGISLDFSRWNEIEIFDVDNLMAIVPPGITLRELNAVAAAKGLRFIPADTPMYESLSVGEWAYRGCPNPSAWKYGAGKHFLLGATYVFPNGDMTPVGGRCIKNVTGYDFTRFLTGPYADLAVGVQYIIKLMPQPACRQRFAATLASLASVTSFIDRLQNRSVPPAWLFWADAAAGRKLLNQGEGHTLLFELDGNEAEVRDYAAAVNVLLTECGGTVHHQPPAPPDMSFLEVAEEAFWLLDEFKMPYQAVPAFADRFVPLLTAQGGRGGLFGHLADGRIHLYLEQVPSDRDSFIADLQQAVRAVGGTGSGKYARLYQQRPDDPLTLLESAFRKKTDPALLFNRQEVAVQ